MTGTTFKDWKENHNFTTDYKIDADGHTWVQMPRDMFGSMGNTNTIQQAGNKGWFLQREDKDTVWIKHSLTKFDKLFIDRIDEDNKIVYLK